MDPRIAYLSTYPPRRCGIATFTHDLRSAVGGEARVFALGPIEPGPLDPLATDPPEVLAILDDHQPAAYRRAAVAIDGSGADVVSLQHEYGIYGGADGEHVLELVDRLRTPIVSTFHTILSSPTKRQRAIVHRLASRSARSVVMSQVAARLLADGYGVDPGTIATIPHGVPDLPRIDPTELKQELGLDARPTALSFGLIGPGKGYEVVVEAMATVRETLPDALYVILGTTHPDLVRREGTRYLDGLRGRVASLGLGDTVRFEDRYLSRRELGRWLQAGDVFVTPYPNLDQIVSGTLSYALGAGLAIVSTPYLYAREVLAGDRGLLVPPMSASAMSVALAVLLGDRDRRERYAIRAHALGRTMVWPAVGSAYRGLFRQVGAARPSVVRRASVRAAGEPVRT